MHDFLNDFRFEGIKPFESKVWLSSPTMHGDEDGEIIGTTSLNPYKSKICAI